MIGGAWRVLDAGSGDRPFGPATVLLDRLPRTLERADGRKTENPSSSIVRQGKPFLVGGVQSLPFADHSFDFVYASHVIEHVVDPLRAARELERVAPRGYIECPPAWFEFVDGNPFHRWLIDFVEGELHFRPKSEAETEFIQKRRLFDVDPALFARFYGQVFQDRDPTGTTVEKGFCHICAYWEGTIPCRILPPFATGPARCSAEGWRRSLCS
jgi:SAM-dependent methyltransferase